MNTDTPQTEPAVQQPAGRRATVSAADDDRRRRRTAITMLVLGAAILGLLAFGIDRFVADEQQYRRELGHRDNPPQRQWHQAQSLLTGLNSRDPAQVLLGADPDRPEVTRNIVAAMPNPGCQYTLESVRDGGVRNDTYIGTRHDRHVYRYDMLLQEHCRGAAPVPVTIGVLSVSGMGGYWEPMGLTVEQ